MDVPGKVLVDEGFPGEIDEEGFVLRVGETDQVERGFAHGGPLVVHGAGAVDEDAKGDGQIFVAEGGDCLGHTVLKDLEGVTRQGLDCTPVAVDHAGIQAHFADVGAERVGFAFALHLAFCCARRGSGLRGWRCG